MHIRLSHYLENLIMFNLETKDIANLSSVSKKMKISSEASFLWSGLFKRDFGHLDLKKDMLPKLAYKAMGEEDTQICIAYELSRLIFADLERPYPPAWALVEERNDFDEALHVSRQKFLEKVSLLSQHITPARLNELQSVASNIVITENTNGLESEESRIQFYRKICHNISVLCRCNAYATFFCYPARMIDFFAVLHKACFFQKTHLVKMLIENKKACINKLEWLHQDNVRSKVSPLGAALLLPLTKVHGDFYLSTAKELVDYLLSQGANPDAKFFPVVVDDLTEEREKNSTVTVRQICQKSLESGNFDSQPWRVILETIINAPSCTDVEEVIFTDGQVLRFHGFSSAG